MSKKIVGDNNIMVSGNENTILQSPIINISPRIIKKIEVEKPDHSITEEQAYEIKRLVNAIVENTGEAYSSVWNKFKRKFKIASYRALPAEKYEEAINYLNQWAGATTKKLKQTNVNLYRKKRYTDIYARIKNKGITKEQLHDFLKKSYEVESLTELSIEQLDAVYLQIMKK